MKTIKIFLASSEELNSDRLYIGDLVRRLNINYERRGVHIELLKWEDFNHAYTGIPKQEEYNDKVRESDIFIALFYTTAGDFTIEEFNVALEAFESNKREKPFIYVYIKSTEGKKEDDKLLRFKSRVYNDLGHYWQEYCHIDKLMYEIVMELQNLETQILGNVVYVKDSQICLSDGSVIAQMKNLPFASNNSEWIELTKELAKQERKIELIDSKQHKDAIDYELLASERQSKLDIKTQLDDLESKMFNTALSIVRNASIASNERIENAKKCFEAGDFQKANSILNLEEISSDCYKNIELFQQAEVVLEETRQNLVTNLNEYKLKITFLLFNTDEPDGVITKQVRKCYEDILHIMEVLHFDDITIHKEKIYILRECMDSHVFSPFSPLFSLWEEINTIKKNRTIKKEDKLSLLSDYLFIKASIGIRANIIREKRGTRPWITSYSILRILKLSMEYKKVLYGDMDISIGYLYSVIGDTLYNIYVQEGMEDKQKVEEIYNCMIKSAQIKESKLSSEHPDIPNTYNSLGFYLYNLGYLKDAIEVFHIATEKSNYSNFEIRMSDNIIYRIGSKDTYFKSYKTLFKLNLIRSLISAGDGTHAIDLFMSILDDCYYKYDIYYAIARININILGNSKSAIIYFEKALNECVPNGDSERLYEFLISFYPRSEINLCSYFWIAYCYALEKNQAFFSETILSLMFMINKACLKEIKPVGFLNKLRGKTNDLVLEYNYVKSDFKQQSGHKYVENQIFNIVLDFITDNKDKICKFAYVHCIVLLYQWAIETDSDVEIEKCALIIISWFIQVKKVNNPLEYSKLQQFVLKKFTEARLPMFSSEMMDVMGVSSIKYRETGNMSSVTIEYKHNESL